MARNRSGRGTHRCQRILSGYRLLGHWFEQRAISPLRLLGGKGHGHGPQIGMWQSPAGAKRRSMAQLTQHDCNRIATKLNRRPRKRLGYRTPEECYVR